MRRHGMVRKGKGIMKKHVFSAGIALMLAFVMVLSGCITIVTPTNAPDSVAPEVTTQVEETTKAPEKTEAPTTPAPTEATTEKAPETTEAPTEAPTEPPKPAFKTGMYIFSVDPKTRSNEALVSATYYFSDEGQFKAHLSYNDAGSSYNNHFVGNYVVTGETVTCYYWFVRGADVSIAACMFASDEFTLKNETTLQSKTVSKGETLDLIYSTDKDKLADISLKSTAAAEINSKYLTNDRGKEIPSDLKLPVCTTLYAFPGEAGKLLGDAELALYENGRFCISLSFTDGAGGSSIVGNYVKDEKQIHCYAWFVQAGDPMFYVSPDTVYDFTILDNGELMLDKLNDTENLNFKKNNDQSKMDYYTKYDNFATAIQYGYISKSID